MSLQLDKSRAHLNYRAAVYTGSILSRRNDSAEPRGRPPQKTLKPSCVPSNKPACFPTTTRRESKLIKGTCLPFYFESIARLPDTKDFVRSPNPQVCMHPLTTTYPSRGDRSVHLKTWWFQWRILASPKGAGCRFHSSKIDCLSIGAEIIQR